MEAARSEDRPGRHSGRLLLRMPEGLHAALARESERKGMSLNAFITGTLAGAVGWEGAAGARKARRPGTQQPPADAAPARRRVVERLLVANLVVVAAVGVLAIVLLVRALQ